ncbi:deoxyribonuclease IV [Halobacteriales archaeon Cl-PHB]
MLRIGAHVSISGGVPNAVDEQVDLGGNAGQIFVGSPRTWSVSEVDPDEAQEFQAASDEADVGPWITHGTYLINFATPKDDLADKSVDCVQAELDACAELGVPYYVFHPGAHTGAGVDQGLENVGDRLSRLDIPEETTLLLENTAGKGTTLGKEMEHLERMVEGSTYDFDDVGVCLDSCHLWAAGYDFTTDEDMADLVAEIEATFGLENLHYLHLNDSKHPLGSEKDEHEHIGEGEIGDQPFETLVNHDATRDLPMVLETPVDDKGYDWNIEKVRSLRH